mmetsp:Transcript_59783/g.140743  ORF Transcript_59783/g.140743 Transcript_59783/m.140743 type:complete len:628 (+) Transcript_59783:767-2650(+)
MLGDLPHAEEAEHVIDTVRMEVLLHVLQAPPPPAAPIPVHVVPVVGREAPVLLGVAWRASIAVELEEAWLSPHVLAASGDADGEIALDGHTLELCVLGRLEQLKMEVVLREVDAKDLVVVRARRRDDGTGLRRALGPLGAVEPLVVEAPLLVKLHLERSVRLEPTLVLAHPLHHLLVALDLLPANRIVDAVHELALLVEDLAVVDLPVPVQLVDQTLSPAERALHVGAHLARVVLRHGLGPHVDGMQRERRRRTVRRGVLAGVVDGEDLDELEPRLAAPVRHELQIEELADASALASLDARHGDRHARALKGRIRVVVRLVDEQELGIGVHVRLAVAALGVGNAATRVEDRVLVLERDRRLGNDRLSDVDAAPNVSHGKALPTLLHPDAVPSILTRAEQRETHSHVTTLSVLGRPGDVIMVHDRVFGVHKRILQTLTEDRALEARGGERRGLGGAEGVVHLHRLSLRQPSDVDGALGDTRLITMRVGQDDVLILSHALGNRDRGLALPSLAALLAELGRLVLVAIAESVGRPNSNDGSAVDLVVDLELQGHLSGGGRCQPVHRLNGQTVERGTASTQAVQTQRGKVRFELGKVRQARNLQGLKSVVPGQSRRREQRAAGSGEEQQRA